MKAESRYLGLVCLQYPPTSFLILEGKMDIGQIKKAHHAAAKIVAKLGEEYLIFFERMHQTILELEKKSDLKSIAVEIAKSE